MVARLLVVGATLRVVRLRQRKKSKAALATGDATLRGLLEALLTEALATPGISEEAL